MRQRAFIHVTGSGGSGKTAFVEALLQVLDSGDVACVRAFADGSLKAPKESKPRSHPELCRYRQAGAGPVALYRFPPADRTGVDAFFMSDVMEDYSTAVVIEGDCPLEFADLTVFVARPLPVGESLLRRVKRDHAGERKVALDAWERALSDPQEMARFFQDNRVDPIIEQALRNPKIVEQMRAGMAADLERLRLVPPPEPTDHWALAPGYEGIEWAGLVIGNVHGSDERPQADRLLRDIERLRKDESVFNDVLGWRGTRIPITAVVADLGDPKDAGLKKALARAKRAVRSAS